MARIEESSYLCQQNQHDKDMPSDNEILKRIKDKVGSEMKYSNDFIRLAQAIEDETGEVLGVNTLKRLFGYKMEKVVPRESTMDLIAKYLGFSDYKYMLKELGPDADISVFAPVDSLDSADVKPGTQVQITYDPNRVMILSYMGENKWLGNEIEGSHNIKKGDILTISQMAVGFQLIVSSVQRDGVELGSYLAAQERGLKSIEIID